MFSVAGVATSQLWDASPMPELYHMADSVLAWNEEVNQILWNERISDMAMATNIHITPIPQWDQRQLQVSNLGIIPSALLWRME